MKLNSRLQRAQKTSTNIYFVDESAIIMVNKGALEAFTICLKRSRDIKTIANISEALLNLAAHGTEKLIRK